MTATSLEKYNYNFYNKTMLKNRISILLFFSFIIFSTAIFISCKQAAEPQPPKRRDPTAAEQYFINKIKNATGNVEINIELSDKPNQISDMGYIYEAIYELNKASGKEKVRVTINYNGCAGSLNSIQPYEFENCEKLKKVIINHTIGSIGESAFAGCTNLKTIEIYNGTTKALSVGNNAFRNSGLEEIKQFKYGNNTNDRAFSSIGQGAFAGTKLDLTNASNKTYIFPSGITSIAAQEFAGLKDSSGNDITGVTIPSHITSIGSGAFSNCTSLNSVTFAGNAITSLAGFDGCADLANVSWNKLPNLKIIGTAAFSGTGFSGQITNIPNSVTEIQGNAFSGTKIASVTIPANVETLGSYAFSDCEMLTDVTFTNGGSKIAAIESGTFKGDKMLSSITIPANVTAIGESAFEGCESLEAIKIPSKVTSIGKNAFKGCIKLKTITVEGAPASLGAGVFDGLPNNFEIKTTDALYTSAWYEYASHIKVQ